jgi:hypothetical protein
LGKLNWTLNAVTCLCLLVPILYVVVPCALSGNLLGLFVPPQLQAALANLTQARSLNSTLSAFGVNLRGFEEPPQVVSLAFNESTGNAVIELNITNPLIHERITVNQFSFTVKNGTRSFTIHLVKPAVVEANWTGVVSLSFSSTDPEALRGLVKVLSGGEWPDYVKDLEISNLYADINGIVIQASDLGKLSELLGKFTQR